MLQGPSLSDRLANSNSSDLLDRPPMVSVVMPCLNEERTVGRCVRKALEALDKLEMTGEVIVSDNGSSDGSVQAASAAGARVVHCPDKGYGNAIRYGVDCSRGCWLIIGDADDSYDFRQLHPFIKQLEVGTDLVMGNRFRGGIRRGAMPWKNRYLGNPLLTKTLNLLFHTGIGDSQCGLRAFTREAFNAMHLECSGMEFATEMLVKATKLGMAVAEVPTTLDPDGRDRPPHLAPWSDGWRILKFLFMFSPLHLFIAPGALLFLLGAVLTLLPAAGPKVVAGFRFDTHWMVLGVLLTLVGVQVMQFGVVARLYAVTHRFFEHDRLLELLRFHVSLERGLLVGAGLFSFGFIIDSWILTEWVRNEFGELDRVRPALLATGLMVLGVQIWFFSFLFSILDQPTQPRRLLHNWRGNNHGAAHPAPQSEK